MKPERELDGVGIVEERRDPIEPTQAILNVLERVVSAIRCTEEMRQLRVHFRAAWRRRRCDAAPPQAFEARSTKRRSVRRARTLRNHRSTRMRCRLGEAATP